MKSQIRTPAVERVCSRLRKATPEEPVKVVEGVTEIIGS